MLASNFTDLLPNLLKWVVLTLVAIGLPLFILVLWILGLVAVVGLKSPEAPRVTKRWAWLSVVIAAFWTCVGAWILARTGDAEMYVVLLGLLWMPCVLEFYLHYLAVKRARRREGEPPLEQV